MWKWVKRTNQSHNSIQNSLVFCKVRGMTNLKKKMQRQKIKGLKSKFRRKRSRNLEILVFQQVSIVTTSRNLTLCLKNTEKSLKIKHTWIKSTNLQMALLRIKIRTKNLLKRFRKGHPATNSWSTSKRSAHMLTLTMKMILIRTLIL